MGPPAATRQIQPAGAAGYGAASCLLYPCVQEFSGSVSTDVFEEEVPDHSTLDEVLAVLDSITDFSVKFLNVTSMPITLIGTSCLTSDQRSALSSQGLKFPADKRWLYWNTTWNIEPGDQDAFSTNEDYLNTVKLGCTTPATVSFSSPFSWMAARTFTATTGPCPRSPPTKRRRHRCTRSSVPARCGTLKGSHMT
jgi:hypothetical protein